MDPHLRTPYVYQYNFSIEREIARGTKASAAYVGSSSHKLTSLIDANPMALGTSTRVLNTQPGVAAGTFTYADQFENVVQAHYNSLALGLTKRQGETRLGSFTYQVSYTHGRSIDNASGFRQGSSRAPTYNWGQFPGVSDYDVTNYVSVYAIWELPIARHATSVAGKILGGWSLTPDFSYRSGLPLNVKAGLSRNATKVGPSGAGDPELVQANLASPITFLSPETFGAASTGRVGNFYFDPSAFERASLVSLYNSGAAATNPALRTYGSLGRNAFRGPDLTNVSLQLRKDTRLAERVNFQLAADFFNLLNHTQFNNPSTSITSSLFGQISSTQAARIIQLSARFIF